LVEFDVAEQRGRVRVEDGAKRVRIYVGGEVVADSKRPKLVWEVPYYPAYYLPSDDVRMELLTPSGRVEHSPSRGDAHYFHVKGGDKTAEDAAWQHPDSPIDELRDHIRFDWDAVDAVFEEDEEVFIHPRDPRTRVDILHSSRHVEVLVDGVKVAETHHPTLLFETGLPARYYIPKTDVRMDLLEPTDKQTGCPYKGFARYWTVQAGNATHENLAWSYPTPLPESQRIAGLVSFYNEKVDLVVDGEPHERPKTHFS
jgi:uncharacterized protein (DUF427 family)